MRVLIRYFAVLRDRRGLGEESLEVEPMTVRTLANQLTVNHQLDLPPSLIRIAVNGEFVDDQRLLADGDTVVLIPPVAGG